MHAVFIVRKGHTFFVAICPLYKIANIRDIYNIYEAEKWLFREQFGLRWARIEKLSREPQGDDRRGHATCLALIAMIISVQVNKQFSSFDDDDYYYLIS